MNLRFKKLNLQKAHTNNNLFNTPWIHRKEFRLTLHSIEWESYRNIRKA